MAYRRLRMLWGALDWQGGSGNPYSTADTQSGGTSAAAGPGNVGVRRCVITMDRSALNPADDVMTMHLDWLNMTSGLVDDSWTTTDYTNLETLILAWLNSSFGYWPPTTKVTQFAWYRVGPGITPPNQAQRIYILPTPIAGTNVSLLQASQVATTITFRTAVRRSWGRTYMPYSVPLTAQQFRLTSTVVDKLATDFQTMVTGAAAQDMHLVVTSKTLSASLNVERIEVDDVLDVVRRRRLKHTAYRKLLP